MSPFFKKLYFSRSVPLKLAAGAVPHTEPRADRTRAEVAGLVTPGVTATHQSIERKDLRRR
jgi:hypothetical protein